MNMLKRLAIIFCTLGLTSYASDEAERKQIFTPESQPFLVSGIALFEQGCGDIESSNIKDRSVCISAIQRLKRAASLNQTLVQANLLLAKTYFYQPPQLNWGGRSSENGKSLLQEGYFHTVKALEYDRDNVEANKLLSLYRNRFPASLENQPAQIQ